MTIGKIGKREDGGRKKLPAASLLQLATLYLLADACVGCGAVPSDQYLGLSGITSMQAGRLEYSPSVDTGLIRGTKPIVDPQIAVAVRLLPIKSLPPPFPDEAMLVLVI